MDKARVQAAGTGGTAGIASPGTPQAFASDVGMALGLLDEVRYLTLRRCLGVPRHQANILTAVLALGGANAAFEVMRRTPHEPKGPTGSDVTIGDMVVREMLYGVAGPGAREVPLGGSLLMAALVGGVAVPGVRRAIHRLRVAEQRIRVHGPGVHDRSAPPVAPTAG